MKLVQDIGNEVCDGCSTDRDCGEDPDDCFRIADAIEMLEAFISKMEKR